VLESKSRVRDQVVSRDHRDAANLVQRLEGSFRDKEDLILVGAYQKGSDPLVDTAVALREPLLSLLQQPPEESSDLAGTAQMVATLAGQAASALPRKG
jgi:flagellum-specific ATP synthase